MATKRTKRAKQMALEEQARPSYAGRRYVVLVIFALAASGLVWRAVDQQVLEKDFLQSEGADRYLARVEMSAHRGLITDRRGDVLALSTPIDSIGANPRVLHADSKLLVPLAKALKMDVDQLRRKLARHSGRHFIYLKRRLTPEDAAHVMDVANAYDIRGVHRDHEYRRYYPAGETFAHTIGFTNVDDQGQEGLELAYDDALRGKPGARLVLRDGRRKVVDDIENIRSPQDGKNLALSLDKRLQFIAYRELKAAVRRHNAISGSVVMLDARSGEVLAMVNQPGYNPNRNRSNKGGRLRNRAQTDVFEPGSTMKPFTVAAALDLGKIKPHASIDTSPGYFKVGAARVRDHHNLGVVDVATVLRKSSNVGAAKIALSLDKEDFWGVMDALGFGNSTGSGFPGESSGQLIPWRNWARIDQATLAFGYGISVTTLQLAQAYGALANNGVLMPVTLLKLDHEPEGRRVFTEQTAVDVRQMLEAVATVDGTAPQAAVAGYAVAGKTGTVKKLGANGYSKNRYLAVFAGMAPVLDPRLVLVVMINEPRAGKYYGGQVAGPVFSRVMGDSLRLLNVKPDVLPNGGLRMAQTGGKQ